VLAGKIFVASMLTMAVGAVYLAITRHQPNNIGGGILTFYLIGTAWLTARRRDGETSRVDWILLLIPLTLGVLPWLNGLKVVRSGASSQDGVPVGMMFFMGSVRCWLGPGISACSRVAAFLGHSASRGISGACALGCSSQQAPFLWGRRTAR
jgi:hypothetical protein